MSSLKTPIVLTSFALLVACGDDVAPADDAGADAGSSSDSGLPVSDAGLTCNLGSLPTQYPGEGFGAATAEATQVLARFDTLKKAMEDAEKDLALTPTEAELRALFEEGSPSLSELTAPSYRTLIQGWLADFAAAAGKSWTPADPPPADGGRYGGVDPEPAAYWIFTSRGIDIRQAWEKGSFAALTYHRARTLAKTAPVTPATVDLIIAYFGAAPGAATPAFDRGTAQYSAVYAKRRDNPDASSGLLREAHAAAIRARVAASLGADCADELEIALEDLFDAWERSLLATVVYYAAAAKRNLDKPSPTTKELASALHAIGENIGFIHGFTAIPGGERVIADAQIQTLLDTLGAKPGEPVTTYQFVTDPVGNRDLLGLIAGQIGPIYGFSSTELAGFENNY